MSRGRKNDTVNVILAICILFLAIIADTILVKSIETEKRMQARYNLEQISHCYQRLHKTFSAETTLEICTNRSKTSITGDVYALNSDTLEFIYENSNDVPEKIYFTKDSVGQYFNDWESASLALKRMMLGKDSEHGSNVSYNFDGNAEWIEWKILPDDTHKIKGKVIVVQGAQEDEVLSQYSIYRRFSAFCIMLVVMVMLVTHNANIRRRGINNAI